jgi:hypothetical protein
MVRIKKLALAALVALALAAGGMAAAPQAQLAWSFGSSNPTSIDSDEAAYKGLFGITEPDSEIVATSRGDCTACHIEGPPSSW